MYTETIKLYPDREDVLLTAYIIGESGELHEQGKRPAVLICPGGAYMSCSDREAEPVTWKFASMGYHAFVLRYSTYDERGKYTVPFGGTVEPKKKVQHPQPMRDIGKAMVYIGGHEEEWMLDRKRIAVCGFSAGAHNAAMYSVYWNTPVMTEYLGVEAEQIQPAATILGYTLSDYVYTKEKKKAGELEAEDLFALSNTIFLGTPDPSDELLDEVSPARHVNEHTPPMFLWATAGDKLVPVQHSIRMAHALAEHQIPFEMHVFERGDHGLSVATQAAAAAKSQINRDVAKWTELAEAWLEKRFALELPEMTAFEMGTMTEMF